MSEKSKIKVIVFGGAGFLGHQLVKELINNDYYVKVFDKKMPNEKHKCEYIIGDITDERIVNDSINGCSFVYNFAGWSNLESSVDFPLEVVRLNVLGNTIILDACLKKNVKRYLFASSIYVFSQAGSFYRASKQCCELIVKEYQRCYKLPFTVLRFGSVYGPRASKENAIYALLKMAIENKKIDYWGNGNEIREYIHVADAARGSVRAIDKDYENQYVLLSGISGMKMKDLLTMINEIFNNTLKINYNLESTSEFHYKITPYSFSPALGKKLMLSDITDLGQGLLQCAQELSENILDQDNKETH